MIFKLRDIYYVVSIVMIFLKPLGHVLYFHFTEKPIGQEHNTDGAVCVRVAGGPRDAALQACAGAARRAHAHAHQGRGEGRAAALAGWRQAGPTFSSSDPFMVTYTKAYPIPKCVPTSFLSIWW